MREVTTGDAGSGRVSISSGLKRGDRVVVAGVNSLTDGQKIRISGDLK